MNRYRKLNQMLTDILALPDQIKNFQSGDFPGKHTIPEDFEHAGFKCAIRAGYASCGYVGVPKNHPWAWASSSFMDSPLSDVSIHGGVTYAEWGDGQRLPQGLFWVGFDTAHFDSAGIDVVAETKRLAEMAASASA